MPDENKLTPKNNLPEENKLAKVAEKVLEKVDELTPYGTAERLAAGICMGIPFFLLVGDIDYQDRAWWYFPLLTLFFVGLPYAIINLAAQFNLKRAYDGVYITGVVTIILISLYFVFTKWFGLVARDSISAYVEICDGYIFGSLLMAASALFITNGLVYWNEHKKHKGVAEFWRAYGNVILGAALAGVLHFPYMRTVYLHYFFAITFFAGCGLATIVRTKTKKKHQVTDFLIAAVMAAGFIVLGANRLFHLSGRLVDWVTLFGAESIGLWVIGVDFILVSLKRVTRKDETEAPEK